MTQFLPTNLLALFAPRDPIPYLPPVDKLPYEKHTSGYTGIAAFVNQFEDPQKTPAPVRIETKEERQERRRREKAEQVAYKLEQDLALWNPNVNPFATSSDPYKTLFVARINYDTSEAKLRREFELYGGIKKISIIYDNQTGKPRGYAFIEYERERDMHSAYKHADGKKIDGRRVLVDVERGRTVKGWLPRRLGGGLGGTRRGGPDVNVKHSGREEPRPEDRYMNRERDRDRAERPEHRRSSRSRSRERRRRSRSRSRERRRRERHNRQRSRERDRNHEHDTNAGGERAEPAPEVGTEVAPDNEARRRKRGRSRDRDRRRRRSRSRDRKKRDYDRDRENRRERERPREQEDVPIKEEPVVPEIQQENFENNGGFEADYNNYNNMENDAAYDGY